METNTQLYKPKLILIDASIKWDPSTLRFLKKCEGAALLFVEKEPIDSFTKTLDDVRGMIQNYMPGDVLHIVPAGDNVMRMCGRSHGCPHFDQLKLDFNGCIYACDWGYVSLNFLCRYESEGERKVSPNPVWLQYDKIKEEIQRELYDSEHPIIFKDYKLNDSSESFEMEHLTGACGEFITFFGSTSNGYFYMHTDTDNVDSIINVPHNRHSIINWDLNCDMVSQISCPGSPSLEERLAAAKRAQEAGYRVRISLDPIIPFEGWQKEYRDILGRIFYMISPERVTLGDNRFRCVFENTNDTRLNILQIERDDMYSFMINEIRKQSNCSIDEYDEPILYDLTTNLDTSKCRDVCQFTLENLRAEMDRLTQLMKKKGV